jgi:hypothetical protein
MRIAISIYLIITGIFWLLVLASVIHKMVSTDRDFAGVLVFFLLMIFWDLILLMLFLIKK